MSEHQSPFGQHGHQMHTGADPVLVHEVGDLTCAHLGWTIHVAGVRHTIEQVRHFTGGDGCQHTQLDDDTVLPSHTSCFLDIGRHHSWGLTG